MYRVAAGATGLIGKALVDSWLKENHQVLVIGRSEAQIKKTFGSKVEALTWEALSAEKLKNAEVIVNLAGTSVGGKRWSDAQKKSILTSRVKTTDQLAQVLVSMGHEAPRWFNASAIGVYGLQENALEGLPVPLDETSPIDFNNPPDFLAEVGRDWEKATQSAREKGVRIVLLRFAVVLAKDAGALPQIVRPFQFFVGGPIGSGKQPFSWVALEDVIRAINFLIEKSEVVGPFNIVAPQCVSQSTLAQEIGKVLHRPSFLPTPAFAMSLLLGNEMAQNLLLKGQHVYPKRLLEMGFQFKYPGIDSALSHLLR